MKTYGTVMVFILALVALFMVHQYRAQLQDCRQSFARLYVESKKPINVNIWRDERGRLWLRVGKAVTEITPVCGINT